MNFEYERGKIENLAFYHVFLERKSCRKFREYLQSSARQMEIIFDRTKLATMAIAVIGRKIRARSKLEEHLRVSNDPPVNGITRKRRLLVGLPSFLARCFHRETSLRCRSSSGTYLATYPQSRHFARWKFARSLRTSPPSSPGRDDATTRRLFGVPRSGWSRRWGFLIPGESNKARRTRLELNRQLPYRFYISIIDETLQVSRL